MTVQRRLQALERQAATVVQFQLKAIETANLETRLQALEERMKRDGTA